MSEKRDPFVLPKEPKNGWQIVNWMLNEFSLLKKYSETLSRKERVLKFLKIYFQIFIPMFILLYLLISIFVVGIDLPSKLPNEYDQDFMNQWKSQSFYYQYILLLSKILILKKLISILLGGLIFTLFGSLVVGLTATFLVGILSVFLRSLGMNMIDVFIHNREEFSFIFSMQEPVFLSLSISSSLIYLLILGLVYGLVARLAFKFVFILLIFSLSFNIYYSIIPISIVNSLVLTLAFIFSYYKLYLYPYYFFKFNILNTTLMNNPYLVNENVILPLFSINDKLIEESKKNPSLGFKFSNFLYQYRKFNYIFGAKIRHASYSGFLMQKPLQVGSLTLLINEELKPSDNWYKLVGEIKKQIISYEKDTQISIKKERFNEVVRLLEQWKQQNLLESSKWNHYYFDAIDKWIKEANKVAKNLELQQQNIEPIQRNIYRYGTPLHPNRDELIFLGREDIKRELSHKIFTNEQIPAFMIQGQRRVGKTSLINFLPELLGSRFRVVSFDFQGLNAETFASFLTQLSDKIIQKMALKKELSFGKEWVEDWNVFEAFLESIVLDDDIKLLIVLDEYEVLHQIFEQNPKKAEFILGRIRHFLQHQNSISFIFVGLYTFSDLENPNWSDYLVHYERFKVGYLGYEDSIKLITQPTKDFRLKYTKEVADRLYYYTCGHPALIQLLCKRIVDISNKNENPTITMEIVENMVKEVALDKELYPVLVFWKQLCTDEDKATVRKILAGKEVSNKRSLYKLEDYGFVVDGEIRVPIFRIWLERFEGIV